MSHDFLPVSRFLAFRPFFVLKTSFFVKKRTFLYQIEQILLSDSIFRVQICPKSSKIGPKLHPVAGDTPSLTTDGHFQAKLATPRPKQTPRRPRQASQEVLEKFDFFQKKSFRGSARSNLLAPPRGRFAPAGGGSPWLNGLLIV